MCRQITKYRNQFSQTAYVIQEASKQTSRKLSGMRYHSADTGLVTKVEADEIKALEDNQTA